MYLYAFLYLSFSILLSLLLVRTLKYSFPELSDDSLSGILEKILFGKLSLFSSLISVFSLILSFCLNLVPPMFANSLYLSHAKKCILSGQLKKGGTSLKAVSLMSIDLIVIEWWLGF
jgi:hypothetical protein